MGLQPRLAPVRSGAASTQGSGQGSGGFQCRYLVRFRKFPVQVEGYGADIWLGSIEGFSGGFWGRYLVRFRKVPVQRLCEVPEGFGGEDAW